MKAINENQPRSANGGEFCAVDFSTPSAINKHYVHQVRLLLLEMLIAL